MTPVTFTRWRKAAVSSGNGNNCVEINHTPGLVGIRDTKNRDGGALLVDGITFETFLRAVKAERLR